MERFVKTVNGWIHSTNFAEASILYVWLGFEYISDYLEVFSIIVNWSYHFESLVLPWTFLIWLVFHLSISCRSFPFSYNKVMFEIFSELYSKKPDQLQPIFSVFFIINLEHIHDIYNMFTAFFKDHFFVLQVCIIGKIISDIK